MGYLPATAGRVIFAGEDVTRAEPYRRARAGMGYVPQGREIFPGLSVLDNLRMGAVARKGGEAAAIEAALKEFPRLNRLTRPAGRARSPAASSNCSPWRGASSAGRS